MQLPVADLPIVEASSMVFLSLGQRGLGRDLAAGSRAGM